MKYLLAFLIFLLAPAIFVVAVWTRNNFLWQNYCNQSLDIAIYIEYIRQIINGVNNPFSDLLQVHQYNDKFTPILYVISKLIVKYLGKDIFLSQLHQFIWIIELSSLLLLIPFLLWEILRNKINLILAGIVSSYFFLNIDLFQMSYNPGHTALWGVAVLVMMGWTAGQISVDKTVPLRFHFALFLGYLYLCLLDEKLSFIGLMLGIGFLFFTRDRLKGLLWIFWALFWVWTSYIGRKMAFGEIEALLFAKVESDIHFWFLRMIAVLPLIYVFIKNPRVVFKTSLRPIVVVLLMFIPIFILLPFGLAFVTFLSTLILLTLSKLKIPMSYLIVSFILMFSVSIFEIHKTFTSRYSIQTLACVREGTDREQFKSRTLQLNNIFQKLNLRNIQTETRILTNANLAPQLLLESVKIRVFNWQNYFTKSSTYFDYIIIEKRFIDNELIKNIKEYGLSIIIDDENMFVAQGNIATSVFDPFVTKSAESN